MARFSDPLHPRHAAARFAYRAGNYILHFDDGTAYSGRQSPSSDRIGKHLRRHGPSLVAVQIMMDHADDPCRRAAREKAAVRALRADLIPVRNRVTPSTPRLCVGAHEK
ncbi:MAG: hypothetical protein HY903_21915 [Deltaproteobacteria bacterium]|nr:hypothetical protein [Deltaproteobacteria bacterium]